MNQSIYKTIAELNSRFQGNQYLLAAFLDVSPVTIRRWLMKESMPNCEKSLLIRKLAYSLLKEGTF